MDKETKRAIAYAIGHHGPLVKRYSNMYPPLKTTAGCDFCFETPGELVELRSTGKADHTWFACDSCHGRVKASQGC